MIRMALDCDMYKIYMNMNFIGEKYDKEINENI